MGAGNQTGENIVERQPVSSSTIASVGYDGSSETLEIEFHKTGLYQYFNVPAVLYDAMMALPNVSAVHIALTPASAGIVDLVVRLDPIRGPAWFENETVAIVLLITALVGIAIFEAVNSTGHGRHKRELALRAAITGSLVVISTAYVLVLLNMIGAWPI